MKHIREERMSHTSLKYIEKGIRRHSGTVLCVCACAPRALVCAKPQIALAATTLIQQQMNVGEFGDAEEYENAK